MSNPPFLSVVIPTYNRRASLQITLEALARQSFPLSRSEVVVVSDGSSDDTDAFLAEFAARAPFSLRAVSQANSGPARARNRGVTEASGEIAVFLDDDVEPTLGFLAAHASRHEKNAREVIIGPMLPDKARARREPPWIAWEHSMLEKQYESWRTGAWEGVGPNHFYTGNASLRREHILAVGGFDETFKRQEDVELAYRMERECGLTFRFDAAASGLHRPRRTFASWLNVPYAYGRLDVVRARRGDSSWDIIRHNYFGRDPRTRAVADRILAAPVLSAPMRRSLKAGAQAAYACCRRSTSIRLLSVLYNVRYLEGAKDEIGSYKPMRRLLDQNVPPLVVTL